MNISVSNAKLKSCQLVFKPEESRPARALAYAPNLRGDDSRPHRYRHMLRGSVEGVMGASFNGRSSVDEDEKAADDVSIILCQVVL